jgi:tRNA pseudouridine55 synthase
MTEIARKSGILLLDKPTGLTSFDVVRRVRCALKVKKVGHLGTLDPFATGLLPLCLQEATKLVPLLIGEAKSYRACLRLGEETDTQDLTGQVVSRSDKLPAPKDILRAAASLVGEIQQVPPLYSALHHQGERLYRLARRGQVVPRAPRPVTIHALEVEEIRLPEVTFTVTCSKGTYIRTLAADLGTALRCGAHLRTLRRLKVGHFRVDQALPGDVLGQAGRLNDLAAGIIPLVHCLPGVPALQVDHQTSRRLQQGQTISWPLTDLPDGEQVQIVANGELVAVANIRQLKNQAVLAPTRVFCC